MRRFPALAAILTLSACNSQLDQLTADAPYIATQRCISTYRYDVVEALDNRHLLFRNLSGDDMWINRLRSSCRGLGPSTRLTFTLRSSRVCASDTATVAQQSGYGAHAGPTCSLGNFQEVTEPQVRQIRHALSLQ